MPGFALSVIIKLLQGKHIRWNKESILELKIETFVAGFLMAIVFLMITWAIVSFFISYEGGKEDRSGSKRRLVFYIVGFVNILILFAINYLPHTGGIERKGAG